MSLKPQNTDNQEIDLSDISKKIGGFFEAMTTSIFKGFLFFKRNIILVSILFFLGAGLGYYLDKNTKIYNHQVIVTPNFESVDYLYAKINLINSKISENDTVFLKNVIGIKNPRKIQEIYIEPISDVYKFIENKTQNFELIKLMAEDGNIKNILTESLTSKNYTCHSISFVTAGQTSNEKTVAPIMKYLNRSDYYKIIQKESLNNINIKIVQNDTMISQINGLLNSFSKTNKKDETVYYSEKSQLSEVIKTKDELTLEQGELRIELFDLNQIVKEKSSTINIKSTKIINGQMKLILPFMFLSLFILIRHFKKYYKSQMAKLIS